MRELSWCGDQGEILYCTGFNALLIREAVRRELVSQRPSDIFGRFLTVHRSTHHSDEKRWGNGIRARRNHIGCHLPLEDSMCCHLGVPVSYNSLMPYPRMLSRLNNAGTVLALKPRRKVDNHKIIGKAARIGKDNHQMPHTAYEDECISLAHGNHPSSNEDMRRSSSASSSRAPMSCPRPTASAMSSGGIWVLVPSR